MGADGHIVIARTKDFKEANPGVEPKDLFLYQGEFLGEDCCWGYYGDYPALYSGNYMSDYEGADFPVPNAGDTHWSREEPYTEEEVEKLRKAAIWFDGNAEDHEVWT